MSRTGREPKLPWALVPEAVKADVARLFRSPVARAERVFGGYSPSATFRVRLRDGRRAFFKGVHAGSNDIMRDGLEIEERLYRTAHELLGDVAPRFLGSIRRDDWHALLLEDLGPATVPPWTAARAQRAMTAYARFHARTLGRPVPPWIARRRYRAFTPLWHDLGASGDLERTASLARAQDAALEWLDVALPVLDRAARALERERGPEVFLHMDTRSDNLRLQGTRLRLFDWNLSCTGAAEVDVVAFAQSIAVEGGPPPERLLDWYARVMPLRPAAVTHAVATIAGFFADRAWRAPIPGLPRLRPFQRRQLKVTLAWAARALELPEPRWLNGVRD